MTTAALTTLSAALLLGVIGLRCRLATARRGRDYCRAAYLAVPTAREEASTQALVDELFTRTPGSMQRIEVFPAPLDDGGALVLTHGLNGYAVSDLLALAFEKVEGEAA